MTASKADVETYARRTLPGDRAIVSRSHSTQLRSLPSRRGIGNAVSFAIAGNGLVRLHSLAASRGTSVRQTKAITRKCWACYRLALWRRSRTSRSATNYQDLWWAAPANSESGWGIHLAHQGDNIFATWFTYDQDGTPLWLVVDGAEHGAVYVYQGDLYRAAGLRSMRMTFNPAISVDADESRASMTFTFADSNAATLTSVRVGPDR